jgi:hypothetical protein
MRLRCLSIRCEYEFNKEPVFLDQAETVAILTDYIAVRAQFPGRIGFPHEVTTVAKVLAFLDVVVKSEGKNDAERRNNKQKRNKYPLFLWAQPPFQLVNYFIYNIEHVIVKKKVPIIHAGKQP